MNSDTRVWDLRTGDVFRFVADAGSQQYEVLTYIPATDMRDEYWRVKNIVTGNVVVAMSYEEVELVLPASIAPEIPDTIEVFLAVIGA